MSQRSENIQLMNGIEVPPFRNLREFLLSYERYERPPMNDWPKWNNRILSNLLYFQTNYYVVLIVLFGLHTFFSAQDIFLGLLAIIAAAGVTLFTTSKSPNFYTMRRDHPLITLGGIVITAYFFITVLSSVFVVLFAVLFPVFVILLHASLRLRGLVNKIANTTERMGLRTTLMGSILETLGLSVQH